MNEFDLIARIAQRVGLRDDVVLGIGDDAALLQPPPGQHLAVAMDTLNAGVHFPDETLPADVGWKALAVNLSDLAAMGATPAWCTLSLSLPASDARWVDAFLDGFLALAAAHRVALVGGDTTRGPLSVCVAVHGFVAPGRALRRDAARVEDDVWVTGTLGDAAGALSQWRAAAGAHAASHGDTPIDPALRVRLDRPTPRVALGAALPGHVHACIDLSDGLAADLAHVAEASRVGIDVWLPSLPHSAALAAAFGPERWPALQATGGDDYELCFTASSAERAALQALARAHGVPLARIGVVTPARGQVRLLDAVGQPWLPERAGFDHFVP